jgi:L-fucose mutarotase
MLTYQLLHPEILAALAEAGHGAQVLIADGNYPLVTRSNPAARRVFLNLAPDLLKVTDVLAAVAGATPIEAAQVTPSFASCCPALSWASWAVLPSTTRRGAPTWRWRLPPGSGASTPIFCLQ